jgi:hypothetical protein
VFFFVRGAGAFNGAANSHSTGYPISQQTNSGFNAPRLAFAVNDPLEPA